MKVKNQKTAQAAALKIAYKTVTRVLNYSHEQLREKTRWDYKTLCKIRDGKLGKNSPVKHYLDVLMEIMTKAMVESFEEDGATKAMLIKNAMAAIGCELCHQHYPKLTNESK